MSHDGTSHSDPAEIESTARQVVDLYFRNVNTTATTYDVWQVGDALLDNIEEIEVRVDVLETDVAIIEEEIEPIPTLEENMIEVQEVVAKMIFELNELGINFQLDQINEFRIKYLNIK